MKATIKPSSFVTGLLLFLSLITLGIFTTPVLAEDVHVNYSGHVQDIGNTEDASDGQTCGTVGQAKRMEGVKIRLTGDTGDLGIEYRTHVQNLDWQLYVANGEFSGTTGQGLRAEALQARLTGNNAANYDVYYRTHVEDHGWTSWAKNGQPSGSEGFSKRMEAIEMKVLPKGSADAPDTSGVQYLTRYGDGQIRYHGHVQNIGWQDYVTDGTTAGTTGQNLRLEALGFSVSPNLPGGSVLTSAYVEGQGWQNYHKNTESAGTVGSAKALQAVRIRLTDDLARQYDVKYRVHLSNEGWKDWVVNNETAGSPNGNKIEAIQVVLEQKDAQNPDTPTQPDTPSEPDQPSADDNLELEVSQAYFTTGVKEPAVFTVKSQGTNQTIGLYKENNFVGNMHDDGINGDEVSNDKIYSYQVDINEPNNATLTYHAQNDKAESNAVKLYVFDPVTDQDVQQVEDIEKEVDKINDSNTDENGYVYPEKVEQTFDDIVAYIDSLYQQGKVLNYNVNQLNLSAKLPSGLKVVYSPKIEGFKLGGEGIDMRIRSFHPARSGLGFFSKRAEDAIIDTLRATANSKGFENYTYNESSEAGNNSDDRYENEEVTLDAVKSFGPNQLLLWDGHGGFDYDDKDIDNLKDGPAVGSWIVVGEKFNTDKFENDQDYKADCDSDAIIYDLQSKHIAISGKFVEKHCGNMNNSLVYLACCNSNRDEKLADAFLKKGAAAVVGSTGTIEMEYSLTMEQNVLYYLGQINPTTENYYTLREALQKAKENNSADDSFAHKLPWQGPASEVIIRSYKDNDANYRLRDAEHAYNPLMGIIRGKLVSNNGEDILKEAQIQLKNGSQVVESCQVSGEDHSYYMQVPAGEYTLSVTAPNCLPFECKVKIPENGALDMEDIPLIVSGGETGLVRGHVTDEKTGDALADVTITVRKGWNSSNGTVVDHMMTDTNGDYYFQLPVGYYTVTAEKKGYENNSINMRCSAEGSSNNDITLKSDGSLKPTDSYDSIIALYKRAETGNVTEQEKGLLHEGYGVSRYDSRTYGYCLLDLDNDGKDELIINSLPKRNGDPNHDNYVTGDILGIYSDKGGTVQHVLKGLVSRRSGYYLTKDRAVGYYIALNGMWNSYGKVNGNTVTFNKTIGDISSTIFNYPSDYYSNESTTRVDPQDIITLLDMSSPISRSTYNSIKGSNERYDWEFKDIQNY